MSHRNNKWKVVDSVLGKQKLDKDDQITQLIESNKDLLKQPEGIIAQYKQKKIERGVSIRLIEAWYETQLEVTKHQLTRAAEVKKKETDFHAERFLAEINRQHLNFLKELEFKNLGERYEALEKLMDKTAKMLAGISTKDWPKSLLDKTIEGVIELNKRFFEKILQE